MFKFESDGVMGRSNEGWQFAQPGGQVQEWISKGEAASSRGDYQEAIEWFEKALQRDPLNPRAHNGLSAVYWGLDRVEESLDHLTRALEWDPNDKDIILNCCNVFKSLGKAGDARDILDSYLDRNPWDLDVRRELDTIDGSGNVAGALPVMAGAACPKSGTVKEAEETRGGSFDPADFFNEQGEMKFRQGGMEHARACFEMAVEHNPNHPDARNNLGVILWRQGDLETALEHFHRALELAPENVSVMYNSAQALVSAGELETALQFYRLYLQHNPKDEEAWDEYEALIRQTAQTAWVYDGPAGDEVADVYIGMGTALAGARDFMGAVEAFHRAMRLAPTQAAPLYHLGMIQLGCGQEADAAVMFREALRLQPDHKQSVLELGKILASQGRIVEAGEAYDSYLARNDDADVRAASEALKQAP